MACKICGPKLSLCGLILSVWGIIQLTLMGVFYYIEAVALLEDLPLEEESGHHTVDAFIHAVEVGYQRNSYNCWIAALLYILMGILYKIECITLLEDVEAEEYVDYDDFIKKTQENYSMVGLNCLIAAGIYVVMILLSWLCMHQAQRKELMQRKKSDDDEWYCENKSKVI
ncbi:Ribonuclease kappa [Papilio xuthus]|uniref:Ribonuclease kappa n=1 Tax=Papilio xuthus TaxID=66420 RepID=A0A194QIN7_PAPXU|nr:Ribonuclease kappa [Papilio xuthus]